MEDFKITALPSFVTIESIPQNDQTPVAKYSILNTFIGKNSPTLVKNEIQSWLSYVDESPLINNDNEEKDTYLGQDGNTMTTKHKSEEKHEKSSLASIKPRKKRSFTSLIFREPFVESEPTK